MRFDDLTMEQTEILTDAWLTFSKEERAKVARALQATEGYIARMLRQYRNWDNRRQAAAHEWLADLIEAPAPQDAPAPPVGRANAPAPANASQSDEPDPIPAPQPIVTRPAPARTEISAASAPGVTLNAAVFDLECTDFGTEGYSGYLVAACILPLAGSEVITHRIQFEEHSDDRRLVKELIAALTRFDILVGHNLAAFDLNWLHSRWLFHDARGSDVGDWPRWLYADTYQMARSSAIKTRKSLGNLGDYFGLKGEKTSVYRTAWNNVRSPYRADFDTAMADIIYHCEQDVTLNRGLFNVLWPDALAMRANPLKVSKWGFMPGCAYRTRANDPEPVSAAERMPLLRILEAAA